MNGRWDKKKIDNEKNTKLKEWKMRKREMRDSSETLIENRTQRNKR